jgi:hypothetical protein
MFGNCDERHVAVPRLASAISRSWDGSEAGWLQQRDFRAFARRGGCSNGTFGPLSISSPIQLQANCGGIAIGLDVTGSPSGEVL